MTLNARSLPRSSRRAAGVCVALVCALAACGSVGEVDTATDEGRGSGYSTSLRGVCPDTVVVQAGWWPQPDDAYLYQLFGPETSVDTDANLVTGPLGDTGVTLEVRSGGPALGFQPVSSLLAQDDEILLGEVATDEAVTTSGRFPTVGVFSAVERSPLALLWGDPAWEFTSVADVGRSGALVLVSANASWVDVFVRQGLLGPGQVDTSYQGSPDRFVADGGSLVQQGLVTSEPYRYEHDVAQWAKPVHYLLLDDAYPVYLLPLVVRQDKLDAHRDCLTKLVPLLQQALADYVADPAPANQLLLDAVAAMNTGGFTLSPGLLADANAKQRDLGLIADGSDGVLGSFDPARVQRLVDQLAPVFQAQGADPKPGLSPADLVTDEFLDPSLSLEGTPR